MGRCILVFVDPAPRTRTIIGVGETVKIFVIPSDVKVDWTLDNGTDAGSISSASGNSTIYTSCKTANNVKVKASYQGSELCPYTIETIQPSGILLERSSIVQSKYVTTPSVPKAWYLWFDANIYLEPSTVNFTNLEIFKKYDVNVTLQTTGIFTRDYGSNKLIHITAKKIGLKKWTTKGTIAAKTDYLQLQANSPVNSAGTGDWLDIDWQYSWSGTKKTIELITQSFSIKLDNKSTFTGDIVKDLATGSASGNIE